MLDRSQTFRLPMITREAKIRADSVDKTKRTVEVVWTTGARGISWLPGVGIIQEELSLAPGHVRMDFLKSGRAPVLNNHRSYGLEGVLGVVEAASLGSAEGKAMVRMSRRKDVDPIWTDVEDGIVSSVSVGYRVYRYEPVDLAARPPVYRAVDWEPKEISFVSIGVDPGAHVRSEAETNECVFITRAAAQTQEDSMDPKTASPAGGTQPAPTAPPVVVQPPADGTRGATVTPPPVVEPPKAEDPVLAERTRAAEIRTAIRKAKLPETLADDMITRGSSMDVARQVILDELARRSEANDVRSAHTQVLSDEMTAVRGVVESAILHRHNPTVFKLEDGARQFRGLSLLEIGRDLLERQGIKTRGLDRMELAGIVLGLQQRAGGGMTTSDFPNILANVANKTLRAGYEAAPQTWRPFSRQANISDFKPVKRVALGDAPSLEKVNESGEYKRGSVGEAAESYQLATYGKIVNFSRQLLINDDLGAFTRIPMMFGRAAADLESDTVWGIITANAAMADTVALFHADHGNLASAGAIAIATLGEMRAMGRKQTGIGGRKINVEYRYLMVPAELETVAQQYTTQTNIIYTKGSDYNPFANTMKVLSEPRLSAASATQWYAAADASQVDTIEFAYLEGQEGVYLETRIGFDVDGVEVKARLDFAAKAIDHRGLFRNG